MLRSDETFMRLALGEAEYAANHADVPVGAILIDDLGNIVARGENRRELEGDPTAHAEIVAIRRAAALRKHWRLDDLTLFVTLEPCAMCAGAIVNARIPRVVYGARDPKAGAFESVFNVGVDDRLNHRVEIRGGVLADASVAALQRFFRRLRAAGEK
jgi:tRNA(adenine34) deaminase